MPHSSQYEDDPFLESGDPEWPTLIHSSLNNALISQARILLDARASIFHLDPDSVRMHL